MRKNPCSPATRIFYVNTMINFTLTPHKDTSHGVEVTGALHRRDNHCSLWFMLRDPEGNVALSDLSPTRQDQLWQHTCFELFFSGKGEERYWEMNMSPSGAWNMYSFSSYRAGMCREEKVHTLPSSVYKTNNSILLHCYFDIDSIVGTEGALDVGVSSVLALKNGDINYLALTHKKDKPDFHDREAFLLHI